MGADGIRSALMGRVIHFEIQAADPDRAQAFYTGVFGWTAQPYGGPMDYRLLITGEDGTAGIKSAILRRPESGPVSGAALNAFVCTIEVDSIEATERAVPEAGGEQASGRMAAPGGGKLSSFKATEGNIFGALDPARG